MPDEEELGVAFKGLWKQGQCVLVGGMLGWRNPRVRVWRDLPSVLWDINLLHYGVCFFFFLGVHTEPAQLSARKSEKNVC